MTSFREFWLAWRGQQHAFPSARRWWDLGKVRTRLFCRKYIRGTSRQRNAVIEQLEREVLELEWHLAASPEDLLLCGACQEKRGELWALEDHRARGAFVRSRIRLFREMDRGSHFFYALEKMNGAKKQVTCLLAEDSTPLMELVEMCRRARAFYASRAHLIAEEGGPPRFTKLVSRLAPRHVLQIVAKAISLWLGSVLVDMIHPDQTYTIPDHSIFDNLFLVRDLLELRRRDSLSFALLSLDQEKAFDRVDHGRLTGLVLREPELRLVLSAYADDVLLMVQDLGDLAQVEACQTIYSAASSARVNWVKSSGLVIGDWRQASSLPPALQTIWWNAGPLLYLGVYLSATHPSPPEN
ncbi:unnamed protein product [Caretta caretta]